MIYQYLPFNQAFNNGIRFICHDLSVISHRFLVRVKSSLLIITANFFAQFMQFWILKYYQLS